MCGIAGVVYYRDAAQRPPVDQRLLEAMAEAMVHRGPDDQGFHNDAGVGLAFRRLSIIDLDGGHQPMANADGSTVVVFNGEIYNYQTLRTQLQRHGHNFVTNADTETLVHGYDRWGPSVTNHLNAMFGFAVWDKTNQRLTLARDHLGIKPLYYHDDGDRIVFGSEMRAILADPTVPREIDEEALNVLLTFGYLPSPLTLFRSIRKLRPGHRLVADHRGSRIERFWNTVPNPNHQITEAAAVEEYITLVNNAVERQMMSDVPIGSLLSGGVDSGMVTAVMSRVNNEQGLGPVPTFTIGFGDDFIWDETKDAQVTSNLFGTDHTTYTLQSNDVVDFFTSSVLHLEEPVLSESTFAYHQLTKGARERVKVVLTGQGADEPWAGYARYLGERYAPNVRWAINNRLTKRAIDAMPDSSVYASRVRRAAESLGERDNLSRFVNIHQVFDADSLTNVLHGDLLTDHDNVDVAGPMRYWQRDVAHLDGLAQLTYIDTRMSLPDDLLLYSDKLAMANSLETRVPLLDVEIIEFIERLPTYLKLSGREGKRIHKLAADHWLPDEVINRQKRGFATPIDEWFKNDLEGFLQDTMLASDSVSNTFFSSDEVNRLLTEHRSGARNHRRKLSTLLSFEIWHRQFVPTSSSTL